MGADFVALIPSTSEGMSYSYVFKIKSKLISMVSPELGEVFEKTNWVNINGLKFDVVQIRYDLVIQGLTQMLEKTGDPVIEGVLAFVNSSDCDGAFYSHDCKNILKALKKLKDSGDDDAVIENLIKVFDDAVNGDGIVAIW